MIVDTSALMAIVNAEPLAQRLLVAIASSSRSSMSAGTWIEIQAVSTRRYGGRLDAPIERQRADLSIVIAPVTPEQAEIAREAYRRFGIGTGHPARLNFGDCFAYALSRATGEPLLFVGDDFSRTDIAKAL